MRYPDRSMVVYALAAFSGMLISEGATMRNTGRQASDRSWFVSFLALCLLVIAENLYAAQPPYITLDPSGISRIYPPLDAVDGRQWSLTQGYGVLYDHDGDDYYAQDWSNGCNSEGAKVYAGISGIAILNPYADGVQDYYGNTLVIFDPDSSFALRVAHLQEFSPDLHNGSVVTAGQYVGKVGYTGNVFPSSYCAVRGGHGAHLHIVLYSGVKGFSARPITGTNFNLSGSTPASTAYAVRFAYTTQLPLVKGDSRPDVYGVVNNGLRRYVSAFTFSSQGWVTS